MWLTLLYHMLADPAGSSGAAPPPGIKDKRMLHSHHGPEASDLSTPRMALHLIAVLALRPPTVLIAAGVYSPVAFACLAPGTSFHKFDRVDAGRPHISGTPNCWLL